MNKLKKTQGVSIFLLLLFLGIVFGEKNGKEKIAKIKMASIIKSRIRIILHSIAEVEDFEGTKIKKRIAFQKRGLFH